MSSEEDNDREKTFFANHLSGVQLSERVQNRASEGHAVIDSMLQVEIVDSEEHEAVTSIPPCKVEKNYEIRRSQLHVVMYKLHQFRKKDFSNSPPKQFFQN